MPAIPLACITCTAAARVQIADIQKFNVIPIVQKSLHLLENRMGIAVGFRSE